MTYYELLQVRITAKRLEIEAAYKKAISIYHPDKYPGNAEFAEDMVRSLNAAFNILSDNEKRKNYDEWLNSQAEELYASREKKSKNRKAMQKIDYIDRLIESLRTFFKGLNDYKERKQLFIATFFVIFVILALSPVQDSIQSIFKQGLLGETTQYGKTFNVKVSAICSPKKIVADANSDGFFSYSDLPQLLNNLYLNTGKFISRELADSKVGIFLEIRGNSCNSAVVIVITSLVWMIITTIILYASYIFLEFLRLILGALFFKKISQIPQGIFLRSLYRLTLSKKFNSSWIIYISAALLLLGIFNYIKFHNFGPNPNKIEAPGKGSAKLENPSLGKRDAKDKKNQPDTSDYYFLALNLVNEVRAKGVDCGDRYFPSTSPLRLNDALINAARIHATNMAEMHFFSHTGLDGKSSSTRISEQGYRWSISGENIAAGQSSIKEAVNSWIKSAGHCANLMNPRFTEMGISKASSNDSKFKLYWVQTLAAPM